MAQSGRSVVRLPDGSESTSWEKPFSFSRTLAVDQRHQNASDDNPGPVVLELPVDVTSGEIPDETNSPIVLLIGMFENSSDI